MGSSSLPSAASQLPSIGAGKGAMFEDIDINESEPELMGKIKEQKAKMVAEKS